LLQAIDRAADHGGWAAPNQKLSPQTKNYRPKPKIIAPNQKLPKKGTP